jgi:murein DD-endopeptidase MepM/ murein hydrolase activator NlpD
VKCLRLHKLYRRSLFLLIFIGMIIAIISPISIAVEKRSKSSNIERMQKQPGKSEDAVGKATAQYEDSYKSMQKASRRLRANRQQYEKKLAKLALKKQFINRRVVFHYKNGSSNLLSIFASSRDFKDFLDKLKTLSLISKNDLMFSKNSGLYEKELTRSKKALRVAEQIYAENMATAIDKKVALEQLLLSHTTKTALLDYEITNIKRKIYGVKNARYAMASLPYSNNGQIYVSRGGARSSFVFPVAGPHSFIESFGFPRSGGRRHQGNDIMSATGTPLVACVSGTIERLSRYDHGLGGITIYLHGNTGDTYYYAHLSKIADGINKGDSVTAGQLIGFVGYTGNASSSAPHLHFEYHPGGGPAVSPYSLLCSADGKSGQIILDGLKNNEDDSAKNQGKDSKQKILNDTGSDDHKSSPETPDTDLLPSIEVPKAKVQEPDSAQQPESSIDATVPEQTDQAKQNPSNQTTPATVNDTESDGRTSVQ